MKVWQANIMLILVAMMWGMGFVATDESMRFLAPLQMQMIRFGLGALILIILNYKKIMKTKKDSIIRGSILGLVFFLSMSLQNFGLSMTSVPKNAFLTVTNVIFVPLIIFMIYRIKPQKNLILGIIIMLIGFFFLMFNIDLFNFQESIADLRAQMDVNFGDFLSLLCAIGFAFHIFFTGHFVKKDDPIVLVTFQLLVGGILSFIMSLFIDGNPLTITSENLINSIPSMLYLIVFSSILSFLLQLKAQKYVLASNAAIIFTLESLFATSFAIILGVEQLTSSLVVASFIITFGIIYAETGFKFKNKE